MALISPSTNVFGGSVGIDLTTVDDAYVGQSIHVASQGTGIRGAGSTHSVTVAGSVYGVFAAISLGDDATADAQNSVFVSPTGQVLANSGGAISLRSSSGYVRNEGFVQGIYLWGEGTDPGAQTQVVNYGTIRDPATAIRHLGTEDLRIENYGAIEATSWAVYLDQSPDTSITNRGTIDGSFNLSNGVDIFENRGTVIGSIYANGSADSITNRGRIDGTINLGAGEDSYLGDRAASAGADLLNIFAGDGNDTLTSGANVAEYLDGEGGRDTLDLQFSAGAATIFLDSSDRNAGAARGDIISGVEIVLQDGADRITGIISAEFLSGGAGNDTLSGAGGADTLSGSIGADVLTGGAGNDVFRFASLGEVADRINDFRSVAGNNDAIHTNAAGFGGGLAAGPLAAGQFRIRADNAAQDADDRFIFRTTDKTLWFDANGNAAGAPILIADLQAGATFGLADMVLV